MDDVKDVQRLEAALEALRRSEQRFRALAEATGSVVWSADGAGRVVTEQPAWEAYTGQTFEQYQGYGWLDAIHEDDRDEARRLAKAALAGHTPCLATGRLWHAASRTWHHFELRGLPVTEADGGIREWIGLFIDVSERSRAEEAAREHEFALQLATEGIGIGTWDADLRHRVTRWSPAHFALYGLPPEKSGLVRTRAWIDRLHPEDRERALAAYEYSMWHRVPLKPEYRIIRADTGEVRWIGVYARFIGPPDGEPERLVGISFDITSRKSVELALRESEERYRLATQALRGYIYDWDIRADRVTRSEGVEDIFGGDVDLVRPPGARWHERIEPEDRRRTSALFEAAAARGDETFNAEYRIRRVDGELRWVWDNSVLVRDEDGRLTRVVGNVIDITSQKRAEEHREFLIGELNHRVKNTLAIVQSLATQTLRGTDSREEFGRTFSGRLAALAGAHDLLLRQGWGRVDLEALLVRALTAIVSYRRISITGGPVSISANAAVSLSIAMHELATNAVKYGALSEPEGRVMVHWETEARAQGHVLVLSWQERGGPPVVRPPAHRGFGSRLLGQLGRELSAEVSFDWQPAGLGVTIVIPPGEYRHGSPG